MGVLTKEQTPLSISLHSSVTRLKLHIFFFIGLILSFRVCFNSKPAKPATAPRARQVKLVCVLSAKMKRQPFYIQMYVGVVWARARVYSGCGGTRIVHWRVVP